jgi:hypothetical protein
MLARALEYNELLLIKIKGDSPPEASILLISKNPGMSIG